jgi:hypothetical protein
MQPLLFVFVFTYVFPKIGQSVGGALGGADDARRAHARGGDVRGSPRVDRAHRGFSLRGFVRRVQT